MWRPTMFLLCLIAALAGSPLRQAEAAGDLARSLAELDGGDVIETIDGGVGDDAGESILAAGGRTCLHPINLDGPSLGDPPSSPILAGANSPSDVGVLAPAHPTDPLAAHHARRFARLQAFRF